MYAEQKHIFALHQIHFCNPIVLCTHGTTYNLIFFTKKHGCQNAFWLQLCLCVAKIHFCIKCIFASGTMRPLNDCSVAKMHFGIKCIFATMAPRAIVRSTHASETTRAFETVVIQFALQKYIFAPAKC
jgi:hypothetical protein